MNQIKLNLVEFLTGEDYFYIHREDFKQKKGKEPHTHTFPEIFIVERGTGLHVLNGCKYRLSPGTLCLIKGEDCHAFHSRKGMQIVNIAFPAESLTILHRYKLISSSLRDDRVIQHLDQIDLNLFSRTCLKLSQSRYSKLDLEFFFLEILKIIRDKPISTEADPLKEKTVLIRQFYSLLSNPDHLSMNVTEMAREIGISREHLSRELQKELGRTAIQMINEARVKQACFQLKMTRKPIKEIARGSGYDSMGQFYSVFKQHKKMTPREYRNIRP